MAVRRFKEKPSNLFCDEVVRQISNTGEPEKVDGLYNDRIPKSAEYEILRRVFIDGKKRPNGDMAPCPMCSPNRFLEGDLVWVREMNVVALIGRCCARYAAQADRAFKVAETKRMQEDFLLAALLLIPRKLETVASARSLAEQTITLYRKLRTQMPELQQILRDRKERSNAELVLHEVIHTKDDEEAESDYFGPAGFRGRGEREAMSRDIRFGFMMGTTALIKNYNPVRELADVERSLNVTGISAGEAEAIDFVAALTDRERVATVASLQNADKGFEKFMKRAKDCVAFLSEANIQRLNEFGTHPLNHQPFEAAYKMVGKNRVIQFRYQNTSCVITVPPGLGNATFEWKAVEYKG